MRIVIDCGKGGPGLPWGHFSPGKGIGGSEEQALGLAMHLAQIGHEVTIHNNCGFAEDFSDYFKGSLLYLPYYEEIPECDALIGWRQWHLLAERRAPVQVLWCHDIPVGEHCPAPQDINAGALENIDRVALLNNYHKGLYRGAGIPEEKLWACEIGVEVWPFGAEPKRIPGRCIFLSHPGRGLHKLRENWPKIKAQVPHATLAAFWWEPEQFMEPNEALGFLPMRSLGQREIAHEILQSEVFAYPCTFGAEISPATTIKAQIWGAIPVVIEQGGMVDTVQFGHKASESSFAGAVTSALMDDSWREDQREPMMKWARETYDWRRVAKRWEEMLTTSAPEPSSLALAA